MLAKPCSSAWPVTVKFGYDPGYPENNGYHFGIDYATPVGSRCWFREAGTVVVSEANYPQHLPGIGRGYWGDYIEIASDRDPSVHWGLCHLSQRFVSVGEHVEAQQEVGRTGATGRTYGAHLHEQCLVDGIRVDPDSIKENEAMTDFQKTELTRIAGGLDLYSAMARRRAETTALTGQGEPWEFSDPYELRQADEFAAYATQLRELLD